MRIDLETPIFGDAFAALGDLAGLVLVVGQEGTLEVVDSATPEQIAAIRQDLAPLTGEAGELAALKAALKVRIEAKRDQVVAEGITVTFPEGPAVIQTRNETDIRNVHGKAAEGLAYLVTGGTPVVGELVFRDAANVNHEMTPAEAVGFGRQVAQGIQAVYYASWVKKAEVDALATPEAAQAYDIDTGWPG